MNLSGLRKAIKAVLSFPLKIYPVFLAAKGAFEKNGDVLYHLASLYEQGTLAVTQNKMKAYKFFSFAEMKGSLPAKDKIIAIKVAPCVCPKQDILSCCWSVARRDKTRGKCN